MTFGTPVDPNTEPADARLDETVRVALEELERRCDPDEAAIAQEHAARRQAPRGEADAALQ